MKLFKHIVYIGILISVIVSCEEERFITEPGKGIRFSMDTLYFDTVFTELGTATRSFTIHNPHKNFVRISRLQLAKGETSVFRINVDGVAGTSFSNIEIPPKDSIYVFVEATLDPNNTSEILLQQDSIVTETNGEFQDLDLVAWGQDVHLLRREVLSTQTWVNDKPYLILDYVLVDTAQVLTMEPGVRIYLHRDALFAVGGTVIARGDQDAPIVFSGDRLEKLYDDIPGQWQGIYLFAGSKDNVFDYTEVKGSNYGFIVDTTMNANPTLEISNSIIQHVSSIGILGRGAKILGYNNIIAHCGSSCLALTIGGSYEFYHSTFANRWNYSPARNVPSVFLKNYYNYNDTLPSGKVETKTEIRDIEKAYFGNCIIYGSLNDELLVDKNDAGILNYTFDHCLTRFDPQNHDMEDENNFINLINYEPPQFVSWEDYDFRLDSLSPAKNAGLPAIANDFPFDLDGNNRTADEEGPDLGAYEWIGD